MTVLFPVTHGYEVVRTEDAIGYADLRDGGGNNEWAVMDTRTWIAAKEYAKEFERPETGFHRSPTMYTQPKNKGEYYPPYHPNTISMSDPRPDTNYDTDTDTLLWIKKTPKEISTATYLHPYSLHLLAVIGYKNYNSFGFLCQQVNRTNRNCRWRVFQFKYAAPRISISPGIPHVSRPILCLKSYIKTVFNILGRSYTVAEITARLQVYIKELKEKAQWWQHKTNEAQKAIETLSITTAQAQNYDAISTDCATQDGNITQGSIPRTRDHF